MSGILYLVSTPIGDYEDITLRALRILREVPVVVCEERREGGRLLAHYDIRDKIIETLNEHNEAASSHHVLDHLKEGRDVALVSDAGTPVFSDPGLILVRKAIDAGIGIVPVPGASSLLPALILSGMPIDEFLFHGFLSPKRTERIAELRRLRAERRTMVFMDTPYRLVPLLRDIAEAFGAERKAALAFNLTLPDERVFRGTAVELHRLMKGQDLKGEFVIVVEGASRTR